MSKNKFIKKLLLAGLCALTATATVGAVACKSDSAEKDPNGVTQTQKYDVIFDLNGGSGSVATQSVEDGGKATKPSDPVREGYRFDGWVLKSDGSEFSFDTAITYEITLKATWVQVFTVTFNTGEGSAVASQTVDIGGKATKPADPAYSGHEFAGWYKESSCENEFDFSAETITSATVVYAKWTVEEPDPSDVAVEEVTLDETQLTLNVGDEVQLNATVTPNNATDKTVTWESSDTAVITVADGKVTAVAAGTAEITATAGGKTATCSVTVNASSVAEYEWVQSQADFSDASVSSYSSSSNKTPDSITVGRFTIGAGVYVEKTDTAQNRFDANGDVNTQQQAKAISFDLKGEGTNNTLSFTVYGSAGNTVNLYKVGEGSDELVASITLPPSSTPLNYTIGYGATDAELQNIELTAGSYYLGSPNSLRIGCVKINEYLEKSEPASLKVTATNVDYLVGSAYTSTGLNVILVYENGREDVITSDLYDLSYDDGITSTAGEKTVTVTYKNSTIRTEYTVYVYGIESISLDTYTTKGNVTSHLKQVYALGDTEISTANLTVTATAAYVDSANEKHTHEFVLDSPAYSVDSSEVNLNSAGTYDITVKATSYETVSATYSVNVVSALTVENNLVTVSVDRNADVSSTNFHSITDAVTYLTNSNLDSGVVKVINIADGEYNEKVYINIPNVQLVGSALANGVSLSDTQNNNVIIWFDAISGKTDPAGTAYGTNGSASVTIGSGATNFKATNITFKNYYNTHSLYTQSLSISTDSQAVALLVEADKSIFENCKITSYHDTLYANKGMQYYHNCWIEGRTDYIFGSDAIAYFDGCTIYSIGAGVETANGGYVVALKPSAANQYYFVFNGCTFDGNSDVKDGSVALGRAWGADMKMIVMNSSISAKFSTAAHEVGVTQANRYCTMSGNEPKPANMIEYNNSGEGAVETSIDNTCTVISATEAEAYSIRNVFILNGWNPTGVAEDVTIKLYNGSELVTELNAFSGNSLSQSLLEGYVSEITPGEGYEFDNFYTDAECTQVYDFSQALSEGTLNIYIGWKVGTTLIDKNTTIGFGTEGNYQTYIDLGKLTLSDGGTIRNNGTDNSQISSASTLTFTVKAGATVFISSYNNYTNYTVKINGGEESEAFTGTVWTYYASEESEIVLTSGNNNYLYSIKVSYFNPNLIDSDYSYSYNSGDEIESTDDIIFVDCAKNNDWIKVSSAIIMNVEKDAVIELTVYQDSALSINGVAQTLIEADGSYKISYTVAETGIIVISNTGTSYVKAISVTVAEKANTGTFSYTVVSKNPTLSGDVWDGCSFSYVNASGANTSANSSDFKFDGNSANVTITLKVTAGQTVTVKVTGYTGSSNKAVGLNCAATGATAIVNNEIEFSSTSSASALEDGTVSFTADSETVTLVFTRSKGNTTRVTEFLVTVE